MAHSIAVVGSGFTGSVIAHKLASFGYDVCVFESRNHIGGNCYTHIDRETGILVHEYGPHIFHTSNAKVWSFIAGFSKLEPFINRVKAISGSKIYSLPINLHTINSFYDLILSPSQAQSFLQERSVSFPYSPRNLEEQALSMIGRELYEAFFKTYTIKQWGRDPIDLPASILKRLPVRFSYNDNYYNSHFQGIPQNGYTPIFEKLLDHKRIELLLQTNFSSSDCKNYMHVFYTGTLDSWFGYDYGRLSYRTLEFQRELHAGDFQGNPVINYCDHSAPWTRITEHKHFTPSQLYQKTLIFKEYSNNCTSKDIPYYPLRLTNDSPILAKYQSLADTEDNVTFCGRLGTYRYLDMHVAIDEALKLASLFHESVLKSFRMPSLLSK